MSPGGGGVKADTEENEHTVYGYKDEGIHVMYHSYIHRWVTSGEHIGWRNARMSTFQDLLGLVSVVEGEGTLRQFSTSTRQKTQVTLLNIHSEVYE